MNKKLIFLTMVGIVGFTAVALACGNSECGKGMPMPNQISGKVRSNVMGNGMFNKTVVATSDGGVVIIMGNKVVKYDRNLKLVNQADLPGGEK